MSDKKTSIVHICNMALGYLGQSLTISSVDEDSTAARVCNRYYDGARRSMLSEYPWRFASSCIALAPTANVSDLKFKYIYSYPASCIRINKIITEDSIQHPDITNGWKWQQKRYDNKRCVCTDAESAYAIFTYDVDDPAEFPALFTEALAWRLALEIVVPLTGGNYSSRQQLTQYYMQYVSKAQVLDANESYEKPVKWGTELLDSRN